MALVAVGKETGLLRIVAKGLDGKDDPIKQN